MEKINVKRILESNEMTMSRIIKDRLLVLEELQHVPRIMTTNAEQKEKINYGFKQQ